MTVMGEAVEARRLLAEYRFRAEVAHVFAPGELDRFGIPFTVLPLADALAVVFRKGRATTIAVYGPDFDVPRPVWESTSWLTAAPDTDGRTLLVAVADLWSLLQGRRDEAMAGPDNRLFRLDPDSGRTEDLAGPGGGFHSAVLALPDGKVVAADLAAGELAIMGPDGSRLAAAPLDGRFVFGLTGRDGRVWAACHAKRNYFRWPTREVFDSVLELGDQGLRHFHETCLMGHIANKLLCAAAHDGGLSLCCENWFSRLDSAGREVFTLPMSHPSWGLGGRAVSMVGMSPAPGGGLLTVVHDNGSYRALRVDAGGGS